MNAPLNQRLLRKLRAYLPPDPFEGVLDKHSLDFVFAHADWNLRHRRDVGIEGTLSFLRDAALYSHPEKERFRKALSVSTIRERLRELLYHNNANVRKNAIYTIGKLGFRPYAKFLLEAFPYYLKEDPINLSGLMFELRWLTRRWHLPLLKQIADAPHYLQRWSLCSRIYEDPHDADDARGFLELLLKLADDPHPEIAATAKDRCKELQSHIRGVTLSFSGSMDFDDLTIRFMSMRPNGTLAQFDRFVKQSDIARQAAKP